MKVTTSILSKLLFIAVPLSIITTSCNKDDDTDNEQTSFTLSGTAAGAKEIPAVTTPATGTLTGSYDKNTHILNYNVNWNGLTDSAVGAHFHGPADSTQNAAVLIPLTITSAGPNGTATGTVTIADSVANFFMTGKMYYNIHSKTYPAGEIRSQVTMQ